MSQDLPYSVVYGKLTDLFKRISDAKVPDTVSHAFLRDTLGFKSSNDRTLISTLRSLGFVDSSGKPTSRYRELKNDSSKGTAIAESIMQAYAPLYEANEQVHMLPPDEIKGLIAQISGTDKDMTSRIYGTFSALVREANFIKSEKKESVSDNEQKPEIKQEAPTTIKAPLGKRFISSQSTEFHFNIQVHLPNNGTEETYLNIFNALRESFQ